MAGGVSSLCAEFKANTVETVFGIQTRRRLLPDRETDRLRCDRRRDRRRIYFAVVCVAIFAIGTMRLSRTDTRGY
ncbi:hypothetical protein AB0H42_07910 [Nocardia sp. NPDC050799]|uniref:hypothetical protein n=1 Tax=Nocardia sp. NPDC050799 TaxID=3154842 RepID=UPI0033EBB841